MVGLIGLRQEARSQTHFNRPSFPLMNYGWILLEVMSLYLPLPLACW